MARMGKLVAICSAIALALPAAIGATPSTTFWAPSTPYLQPFGVLHATYDTYFGPDANYPVDVGLTIGALPFKGLQLEAGADVLYPTFAGGNGLDLPVALNAKIGAPEDVYFPGQPGWSVGIYGVGFKENVTDYNVLYAMIGKTFPHIGTPQIGAYYGLNPDILVDTNGETARAGLLAGWSSPPIDVPKIDKIVLAWDIQTGNNAMGATGGGAYIYFTPAIDVLIGPVYFFEKKLQPGQSSWLWSVQLDADIDIR